MKVPPVGQFTVHRLEELIDVLQIVDPLQIDHMLEIIVGLELDIESRGGSHEKCFPVFEVAVCRLMNSYASPPHSLTTACLTVLMTGISRGS